jgi:hypothetical protein
MGGAGRHRDSWSSAAPSSRSQASYADANASADNRRARAIGTPVYSSRAMESDRPRWALGEPVEVFSQHCGAWCPGVVEELDGDLVVLSYELPQGGGPCRKTVQQASSTVRRRGRAGGGGERGHYIPPANGARARSRADPPKASSPGGRQAAGNRNVEANRNSNRARSAPPPSNRDAASAPVNNDGYADGAYTNTGADAAIAREVRPGDTVHLSCHHGMRHPPTGVVVSLIDVDGEAEAVVKFKTGSSIFACRDLVVQQADSETDGSGGGGIAASRGGRPEFRSPQVDAPSAGIARKGPTVALSSRGHQPSMTRGSSGRAGRSSSSPCVVRAHCQQLSLDVHLSCCNSFFRGMPACGRSWWLLSSAPPPSPSSPSCLLWLLAAGNLLK